MCTLISTHCIDDDDDNDNDNNNNNNHQKIRFNYFDQRNRKSIQASTLCKSRMLGK